MIGVFDSGVGGLGVWREVVRVVPGASTVYLADQAHAPYGDRSLDEIRALSIASVDLLLTAGATMVVVACNTASAAALPGLRSAFPAVPIVGMEPAVKPAAAATRSGAIGILATRATLAAPGFAALAARHAGRARLVTQVGVGWVEAVEEGRLEGPGVADLVERSVAPLRAAGVDQIVLGCTHYPFLGRTIEAAAGSGAAVIDPAPAVARRVAEVWSGVAALQVAPRARHALQTTGAVERFRRVVDRLLPDMVASLRPDVTAVAPHGQTSQ